MNKNLLLNEQETSVILGCSVHKLQKDRRIGNSIPYCKIGRSVRYKLSDIENYIEQNMFNSTSEYKGGRNV